MHKLNDEMLRRLDAFNNWLNDVYNADTNFSTLLIDSGFSETEIEQLIEAHLSEFLEAVLELMVGYTDLNGVYRDILMVLYYGLLDGKPQLLETIGHSVGVGRERIKQLVNIRMDLYRDPSRQAKLHNDFAAIALRLLDNESSSL